MDPHRYWYQLRRNRPHGLRFRGYRKCRENSRAFGRFSSSNRIFGFDLSLRENEVQIPTAHSKLNRVDKEGLSLLFLRTCRLSPRAISTGQLNTLLCLHLRPIDQIVFLGPYSLEEMGDLILGGVSRLDAFSVYLVRT